MPTYDYKCNDCGHAFEVYQSMKDEKLTQCPNCGKNTLRRLIGSGSGLIFKGSGFYLTDYKNKSNESLVTPQGSDSRKPESTEAKGETSKTETKTTASNENGSSSAESKSSASKSESKPAPKSEKKSPKKSEDK